MSKKDKMYIKKTFAEGVFKISLLILSLIGVELKKKEGKNSHLSLLSLYLSLSIF